MHTSSPNDVKYGRDEDFIIDGDCHIAWLMKGRGYGANSIAQVDPPQQEEKLSYREAEEKYDTEHCHFLHERFEGNTTNCNYVFKVSFIILDNIPPLKSISSGTKKQEACFSTHDHESPISVKYSVLFPLLDVALDLF